MSDLSEHDAGVDAMLVNPPYWLFAIAVDGQPMGRVFAPKHKRNWVLWRVSNYVLEFTKQGDVSVTRYSNGKWENANDWRKLSH